MLSPERRAAIEAAGREWAAVTTWRGSDSSAEFESRQASFIAGATAEAERAAGILEALEAVEWSQMGDDLDHRYICPACGSCKHCAEGRHNTPCATAAALAAYRGPRETVEVRDA